MTASDVAEAAAFGDLCAAAVVLTRFLPLGGLGVLLAAFPMVVLGRRRRLRVCVAATATAALLAFLGGGTTSVLTAVADASFGALIGIGARRGWSTPRTALTGMVVLTLPASALAVALLGVFSASRQLVLAQIGNGGRGVARLMGGLGASPEASRVAGTMTDAVVAGWWWLLPVLAMVTGFLSLGGADALLRPAARRLDEVLPRVGSGDLEGLDRAAVGGPVAPLPLRLEGVGIRGVPRPGRDAGYVVRGVDLALDAGAFVTVSGPNGSGKSTLARVVAGLAPDEGTVHRPGTAGLGAPGGTAMVFQRPESQVLGLRVADDVRWGLDPAVPVDVDGVLGRVGLAGYADRETDTLSGGELQRLAVAGMLARDPAVIVSDETTAMLDTDGRDGVVALLRGLAHDGAAVVHITHRAAEIEAATPEHRLVLGGTAAGLPPAPLPDPVPPPSAPVAAPPPAPGPRGGHLRVRGVTVVHDAGTPWSRDVLHDVDLEVPAGTAVLVTGANGAGKTTLAHVLAGLVPPTRGRVLLDGAPLHNGSDGALLAVQHSSQALLGATVAEDVADAAGVDYPTVWAALSALGLDPGRLHSRSPHELSGGEARRVALAGLLAAGPRLLVLDEPLAGLDGPARAAVRSALLAMRAQGTTLVVISHDVEPLVGVVDATVTVADGRVTVPPALVPAPDLPAPDVPAPAPDVPRRVARHRPRRAMRTLPGSSPAHRLHAGTKIGVLVALGVALAVSPAWPTIAAAALVLAGWAALGRVPPGAWPRPPVWAALWLVFAALSLLGGGPPTVTVLGVELGLGGLDDAARLLAVTVVAVVAALLLVATTPVAALPPLLDGAARRLAWTRLPLREWAAPLVIGLRLAPALLGEGRTVLLLLGQRRRSGRPRPSGRRERWEHVVGAASTLCATATRRAAETADAVTARGGIAALAADRSGGGPRTAAAAGSGRSWGPDLAAGLGVVVLLVAGALL